MSDHEQHAEERAEKAGSLLAEADDSLREALGSDEGFAATDHLMVALVQAQQAQAEATLAVAQRLADLPRP